MPRKYTIKMTEEEVNGLLYMVDEEIGKNNLDIYGLGDLISRIELVKSGVLPEFIEEQ